MSIVVYKCDTCKREIELQRNIEGLEVIQRCTITHGCRGKLYQVNLFPDYIRGDLPDSVPGLTDWIPRKVLFNFTQTIEDDEWVIEHNMGVFPVVSVFVDRPVEGDLNNREEIIPQDIIIIDDNTIKLVFDRPWSGIAQLIGRQSDPDLLQPEERTVEQVEQPAQISSGGEITIATLLSDFNQATNINIGINYATSTGNVEKQYVVDNQPSTASPWVDFNRIIVKGKVYTVRSFNGIVSEMANGTINSGSTFRFDTAQGNSIKQGQMLILLASSPYATVDKQRDKFIDVTSVTSIQNQFSLYYDSSEFFAEQDIIQSVFPPIRPVQ